MDYEGIMGVPITYLKYHNGSQFEIVGEANHGSDNEFDLFKPKINGKELFKRILIRRKTNQSPLPKEFRVLDLFCGAGGLSWGMHKNPYFKTAVALDFDEHAAETFKKNMPEAEVIVGDITDPTVKEQVVSLAKENGVNMLAGGPPCQGYSSKGKKLGLKDPRNFLFREYLNLVERLQPDVFVIDWAHPNMRDGNLKKYNQGHPDFWKKEHQVKVWALEYQPVGFVVLHKQEALDYFADEQKKPYIMAGRDPAARLHRYYWELTQRIREKPHHPGENDEFIPEKIRGKHYDTWTGIAEDLGYGEDE